MDKTDVAKRAYDHALTLLTNYSNDAQAQAMQRLAGAILLASLVIAQQRSGGDADE